MLVKDFLESVLQLLLRFNTNNDLLYESFPKVFLTELAYETVRLEIEAADNKYHGNDFPLMVAKRECPCDSIEF